MRFLDLLRRRPTTFADERLLFTAKGTTTPPHQPGDSVVGGETRFVVTRVPHSFDNSGVDTWDVWGRPLDG